MKFCTCGKLVSSCDFGYICICGKKYDFAMNPLADEGEAQRISKRKAYRFKYPNMGDGTDNRQTVVVKESDYYEGMEE